MKQAIVIGSAGAIGCLLRFWLGQWLQLRLGNHFPWNILLMNVLGSGIMGMLAVVLLSNLSLQPWLSLGLMVGLLGGFTTFSSFSLDAVNLLLKGQYGAAIAYIVGSVGGGLGGCYLGIVIGRCFPGAGYNV